MNKEEIAGIISGIKDCIINDGKNSEILIQMDNRDKSFHNQFIIALKPEMTLRFETNIDGIFQDISTTFEKFNIHVDRVKIISSSVLEEKNILSKVYQNLYDVSYYGIEACDLNSQKKLDTLMEEMQVEKFKVLGAYQFLREYKEFSPLSLETFSRNLKTYKLGNGTYCIALSIKGETVVILNPFHPYQREWFFQERSCVVFMQCTSICDFETIRKKCVGELEPENSPEDSLKGLLYNKGYDINKINTAYNGYHISPSLVEAARLIVYLFLDNDFNRINETVLGKRLLDELGSVDEVIKFVKKDQYVTKFDDTVYNITEFMNTDEIIEIFELTIK